MDEAYLRIMHYIDKNPLATLGTVNADGVPCGAVVYVCGLTHRTLCFITKNQTQKYYNLIERPDVSLTIGNAADGSTLQSSGKAFLVNDPNLIDLAIKKLNQIHAQMTDWLPPLSKLRAGNYVVVGVELMHARLGEFQHLAIGSQKIFTEI